ncbi:MAG: hypothetical protein IJW49_08030 [Clostridia bacterium]|nr:hypothetical protein [Clostridia bacterium]
MTFAKNGSEYITSLIADAVKNGSRTTTVTGAHEIEWAIRIPSDFTLILEDCHLRMADGVYSNLFVNEHHGTELGRTEAGTDRNIAIIGKGRAILDGGNYNGLSEKTSEQNGLPHISKNNLLLFTNVDGFTIRDISCVNQRWWALNFIYCRNGYLGNLDFCSSDLAIDENGNEYHGLKRDQYADVVVKNSDGIDLRQGCHHITIKNITGFTEDDTIALTNLNGAMEQMYSVSGLPSDIAYVSIKNVRASAYCSMIRLLNQGPRKLHDISIEDVYDTSRECPHLDRGRYCVRVGDANHLYGERHSTAEETYNISIKNIAGRGQAVLHLAGAIGTLTIENAVAMDGVPLAEDYRTE